VFLLQSQFGVHSNNPVRDLQQVRRGKEAITSSTATIPLIVVTPSIFRPPKKNLLDDASFFPHPAPKGA
jgi:hypothetical protein